MPVGDGTDKPRCVAKYYEEHKKCSAWCQVWWQFFCSISPSAISALYSGRADPPGRRQIAKVVASREAPSKALSRIGRNRHLKKREPMPQFMKRVLRRGLPRSAIAALWIGEKKGPSPGPLPDNAGDCAWQVEFCRSVTL